jgi:aconitate decarboxylase
LKDGARLEETVEAPRGSERNFPSAEEVTAKFSKLVSRRLTPAHAARIADQVLNLDKLIQMDELIGLLALA